MTSELGDAPTEFDEFELVVLVRGPHPPELDEIDSELLQRRHLGHLQAIRDERWRGLCLYQVGSIAEATRLASLDPAVIAGRYTLEVMKWYCPKGEVAFPST
jgi:hypothetical protein